MVLRMENGDAWALLARLLRENFGRTELPRVARMESGKPWFPDVPGLHLT